jgi:hypothetical protein
MHQCTIFPSFASKVDWMGIVGLNVKGCHYFGWAHREFIRKDNVTI